eukprot:m.74381 g.74381  ORF g.74381 m.74381 type:complete len:175 (-) comp13940_c0_seq2:28-552(-)
MRPLHPCVCALLLLLLSSALLHTHALNSTCTGGPRFHHDNYRCKCTCTLPVAVAKEGAPAGCTTQEANYDAGVNQDLCGRETCVRCLDRKGTHFDEQCSYVVVVSSHNECFCDNVMPNIQGPNVTRAYTSDCGLCSCTYESRSQSLVKFAVMTVIVAIGVLLAVAVFAPRTGQR